MRHDWASFPDGPEGRAYLLSVTTLESGEPMTNASAEELAKEVLRLGGLNREMASRNLEMLAAVASGVRAERQRIKGEMMEALEGLMSPAASLERLQVAGRLQRVVDRICPEEG